MTPEKLLDECIVLCGRPRTADEDRRFAKVTRELAYVLNARSLGHEICFERGARSYKLQTYPDHDLVRFEPRH